MLISFRTLLGFFASRFAPYLNLFTVIMWLGRTVNNKAKLEQTITCFCRSLCSPKQPFFLYKHDLYFCCRKARRKDREGSDTPTQSDSKLYLESTVLERKFPDIDFKLLVDLPGGLDYNEWLASHSKLEVCCLVCRCTTESFVSAMSLFEHVNLVYGTISEFCTSATCPDMTGPEQR